MTPVLSTQEALSRQTPARQALTKPQPPEPGAATAPATAPGVAAVATPGDGSPKAALQALTQAVERGDVEAIRRAFAPDNDLERLMVDAVAELAAADAVVRQAALQAFGEQAVSLLSTGAQAARQSEQSIAQASQQVDGTLAQVVLLDPEAPGGQNIVHLRQIEGDWRITLTSLTSALDRAEATRQVHAALAQAREMRRLADEVTAGQYTSPDAAAQSLRARLLRVAMQSPATTRASE